MHTIKIEEPIEEPIDKLQVQHMRVGEFGQIAAENNIALVGHVIVRTAEGFTCLTKHDLQVLDPWTVLVRRLPMGTVLTLTIGPYISADLEQRLRQIKSHNKIDAIRFLREMTRMGLRDAKEYIDNLQ